MSNLTSNCGCGTSCNSNNGIFGGSCIWILLLLFCGGNGCGNGCGNGIGFLNGGDNSCCDWLIWILLINCICGNNGCGTGGNNNNCGCNSSCC